MAHPALIAGVIGVLAFGAQELRISWKNNEITGLKADLHTSQSNEERLEGVVEDQNGTIKDLVAHTKAQLTTIRLRDDQIAQVQADYDTALSGLNNWRRKIYDRVNQDPSGVAADVGHRFTVRMRDIAAITERSGSGGSGDTSTTVSSATAADDHSTTE